MIFWHILLFSLLNVVPTVFSDDAPSPGRPQDAGQPETFKIIGESIVSAQQAFLGTTDKVYFIDTTEANPATEGGHPAWASEYSLSENKGRAMDTITSCAGGGVLGNGTWVNVGGYIQVAYIGENTGHEDGRSPSFGIGSNRELRLLNPCDDENCEWQTTANLSTERLYPAVETLEDGTLFIIGGCTSNVFVNNASTNNPTYEVFPALSSLEPNGTYDSSRPVPKPTFSPFLNDTLPANLYPVTFLLPSGRLLIQANRKTAVVDRHAGTEELLDDVPDAARTHPASAGAVLLPLTPRNRWEATIMLCGGSDVKDDQWGNNLAQVPTSKSCVQLTPDVSGQYQHVDALPEGRVMGNFILLPTGQIMLLNGAGSGVAGIGNTSWSVGQSYADHPILEPVLYDPEASKGQRWSRSGLSASTIPRMYLSSAVLLPDGAILVAGSNPNFNYTDSTSAPYRTEHRLEKLYPAYFSRRRPEPRGLPNRLEYGGSWFDIELTPDDYFNDKKNLDSAKVVVMRTGFSTHAQNMGQRMLELESTMSMNNGSVAIMHVAQITPNPAVFPPGPALLFVVVDGVPSVGVMITVGSGKLGPQDVTAPAQLPPGIASAGHIASAKSPAGGWKRPSSVERMVGMCVAGALSALFA